LNEPRATRTAAILLACLVISGMGAACSNSVLDKCINVCQHVFYDCQGVIKIGNEILTASDYPACQQRCYEAADGGSVCQDPGAAFDCISDTSCEVFQPNGPIDAGARLAECEAAGKCAL